MKSKYLLLVLCLLLIVLPASAALINASVISNTLKSVSLGEDFGGTSYAYTTIPPVVIQELKVSTYTNDVPTIITFTLHNQSTITSSITTQSTSLFTRMQTVSITGGSTSTQSTISFLYPVNRVFFAESNTTPIVYYFVITDLYKFVDLHNAYFDIDTNTDAVLILPVRPSSNPAIKVSISAPNGRFSGSLYTTTVDSLVLSENEPLSGGGGTYDVPGAITALIARINTLTSLILSAVSLLTSIGGLAIFVFSAKTFMVVVMSYMIVTLILSIHDSDDMFKSISKFLKYQMKLLRFFMELYGWIVKLIFQK